ncbi:MAG: hypothetical protein NC834_01165, partial [Candidatus Omnitrophica bacterium]|nr:hypothetical protein [Candidatus Omnitrophota bacterium]
MKINLAITSSGSMPAVAVIKALKKQNELKMHITAMDMKPISAGNFLSDRWLVIPPCDKPNFIPTILKICKKFKIHCLIP